MATSEKNSKQKDLYSVWAIPPDEVTPRLVNLMSALRSEFGGPEFPPHITVVGAISLYADDSIKKLRSACEGLKPFHVSIDRMASSETYLLLHPNPPVVDASAHCCFHFGYNSPTPYMPHLSLLYGDLTDEEKQKVAKRANVLDDSLNGLSFQIDRLALWKTDPEDKTLKSWEKIAEYSLSPN